MKLLYILCCLMCFSFLATGQTRLLDSLRQEIRQAETDSARMMLHRRMVWYNLTYHPDSAHYHLLQAKRLNEKVRNEGMDIILKHYHGLLHRIKGEYAAAIDTFKQVVAHYESRGETMNSSGALFNLGVLHSYIGDYEKSLAYYYEDLKIHEQHGNRKNVANAWNSIGIIHKNRENFAEAIECYDKALHIYENEVEHPEMLANVYNNKGSAYLELGDLDKAEEFSEKSRRLDEELERPWGVAHSLSNLGIIAREKGFLERAEYLAREVLAINTQLDRPQELANAYLNYGEVLLATRKYGAATEHIQLGIQLADNIDYVLGLKNGYEALSAAYEAQGMYQNAYDAQQQFITFQDSILNEEKERSLKNLEIQYDVQKREAALENLTRENQLQAQINKRIQQNSLAWTLAALLLGALLLFSVYWYNQRIAKNNLLAAQQQKVLTLSAMINGQEEERKRIAKDLHDSLGSLLATVKLNFKAIHQKVPELEQVNSYNRVDDLLDTASKEVRRISHDMMPDVLKISLAEGIKDLARTIQESGSLTVDFQEFGTLAHPLTDNQKVMIYRIVQELTQNILKHAEARHIMLQLSRLGDRLQVVVEDDGKGFEIEHTNGGMGLRSIRSRADYLKGEIDFDSRLGVGTTVTLVVPVE